jgi:hypothetical protein
MQQMQAIQAHISVKENTLTINAAAVALHLNRAGVLAKACLESTCITILS